MINGQENGLKGQCIIAQGFDVSSVERQTIPRIGSIALGWISGNEIVRAITFIKEKILFRTKQRTLRFPEINVLQFRPKGIICFVHRIPADGFSPASFTQAST